MSNSIKLIPHLVCPECLSEVSDPESHPAYHNRMDYVCSYCGYRGDSVEFETNYISHPIHKLSSKLIASI